VLAVAHSAHVGDVADEVSCAGDQLQAPKEGEASYVVQLVAFAPAAQAKGELQGLLWLWPV
jgi:hypothetical protein